jgi:hypothetical protein
VPFFYEINLKIYTIIFVILNYFIYLYTIVKQKNNTMLDLLKTLLITIVLVILLVVPFNIKLNKSIESYNTKDIESVKLYTTTLNNGLDIKSSTKFWFCKDKDFKHFDFKIVRYNNLYGMEYGYMK